MNSITLLGRMTKEAEVKYTDSGKAYARFTLAVNRMTGKDGKKEADFINCVLWGNPAELLGNSVHKGQRVLVEGRLQIRSYKDKEGNNRTAAEVVCNSFEYIEKKEQSSGFGQMGESEPFEDSLPF